MQRRARSEALDDLSRALIFLLGVGANEIEVELVAVGFGEQVALLEKSSRSKNSSSSRRRRSRHRSGRCEPRARYTPAGCREILGKVAFELAVVIGLPEASRSETVAVQVLLDAGEDGAGRSAAGIAGRVLDHRSFSCCTCVQ